MQALPDQAIDAHPLTIVLSIPQENACGCETRAADGGDHGCICCATALLQIVGRRYALRLLFRIGERGPVRFNDLRAEMDDVSTSTLSIRLDELEGAGLLSRHVFPEIPPRVEYTLTAEGDDLRKKLFALSKFAARKK